MQRFQLITGVIVVLAASVLVAWGLRRYLDKSPRFAIVTVRVLGNERLSPEQVAKAAGITAGENIFKLAEERAANKLLGNPWIESAKVVKELPDAVRVRVVERVARLAASINGALWLIDDKGVLFKECEPGDPTDLPVVTGIRAEDIASDREGVTVRLRRVIDLLVDLERERIAERFPVQELHLDGENHVTAFVGTEGVALQFGEPPYRLKVEKAQRILAELRTRQVKPDVLFLDNQAHPERAVVRMRAEGALAKADSATKEAK